MLKSLIPNPTFSPFATNCAKVDKVSWKTHLLSFVALSSFFVLQIQGASCIYIKAMLNTGHNDLVEVRLRQLSYHIDPPQVSGGPSSALLAPDCTKNAGIISFFELPSATTLTKGLLLILDRLFASSHPRLLTQTPPTAHHPCPIYPSHPLFKRKTWAPKAEWG